MKYRILLFYSVLFFAYPGSSEGATPGKENRRNRGGVQLQVVTREKKSQTVTPPSTSAPEQFHEKVFLPTGFEETAKTTEKRQLKSHQISKKTNKRPGLYANDPIQAGAKDRFFYEQLSEQSRDRYNEMGPDGKQLALRLSIPCKDCDKAVDDAYFEMLRRQQSVNGRQKRVRTSIR